MTAVIIVVSVFLLIILVFILCAMQISGKESRREEACK